MNFFERKERYKSGQNPIPTQEEFERNMVKVGDKLCPRGMVSGHDIYYDEPKEKPMPLIPPNARSFGNERPPREMRKPTTNEVGITMNFIDRLIKMLEILLHEQKELDLKAEIETLEIRLREIESEMPYVAKVTAKSYDSFTFVNNIYSLRQEKEEILIKLSELKEDIK